MNSLFEAAKQVQEFIEQQGWSFCFIGGLAVLRWGRMRATSDVDLTVLTDFKNEEEYIRKLIKQFAPRIENAESFALINRVLLLKTGSNIGLDISLGGFPFEQNMIAKSSLFEIAPNCLLRTCSAEDLIILKVFAGRKQDWFDVENILLRNGRKLNLSYIYDSASMLCSLIEASDRVDELKSLCNKLSV